VSDDLKAYLLVYAASLSAALVAFTVVALINWVLGGYGQKTSTQDRPRPQPEEDHHDRPAQD